jgi:hypothetical protein
MFATSELNVTVGWPFGASTTPVCVSAATLTLCERALGMLHNSADHSLLASALIERWSKASISPRYKRDAPIAMMITELVDQRSES